MKNTHSIDQISNCLNCKIGVQVIADYKKIYEMNEDDFSVQKELIEELSELFMLDGTNKENFKLLKRLSSNNTFEDGTDMCLRNLQKIVHSLRNIYRSENDEDIVEMHTNLPRILSEMNLSNEKSIKEYDAKHYEEILKLFRKKESRENNTSEIAIGIKHIFTKFCYPHQQKYIIDGKNKCYLLQITQLKEEIKSEETSRAEIDSYFNRVNKLCSESQAILLQYIKFAPKKFGDNFQYVMKKQNMTHQDIAILLDLRTSDIQSLETCDNPMRPKEDIKLLCRTLLISEEVLYIGTGKKYGNWKTLLNKEGIKVVKELRRQEKLKELEELEELDKLKELEELKKIKSTKDFIRYEIKKLIQLPDEEFEKILNMYTDLFNKEDFNVYSTKQDSFHALLHKEEAYTLLEVLEKAEL